MFALSSQCLVIALTLVSHCQPGQATSPAADHHHEEHEHESLSVGHSCQHDKLVADQPARKQFTQ